MCARDAKTWRRTICLFEHTPRKATRGYLLLTATIPYVTILVFCLSHLLERVFCLRFRVKKGESSVSEKPFTNRRYLDVLTQRVLVYGGAMGTSIQNYNLDAADFGSERYWGCNDYLAITRPDVITEIHAAFLKAGADIVVTNTFRANRITLCEYDLHDQVLEINRAAAQLARFAADRYDTPDKPRFIAGSIGPSGKLPSADDPTLSDTTFDELVDVFREQAAGLVAGDVRLGSHRNLARHSGGQGRHHRRETSF